MEFLRKSSQAWRAATLWRMAASWRTTPVLTCPIKAASRPSAPCCSASWSAASSRAFSKVTDSITAERYLEEALSGEDPLEELRHILYPDHEDATLARLSTALSPQEVFDLVAALPDDQLTDERALQAVATLFHLKKVFEHKFSDECGSDWFSRRSANEYCATVCSNAQFRRMVSAISRRAHAMDLCYVAFVYLCLHRLNVDLFDDDMRHFFQLLQKGIPEMDGRTLSYFSVGLRGNDLNELQYLLLWRLLALSPAAARVQELIPEAVTADDVRRITICLNAMAGIVSDRMLAVFTDKVLKMLDEGVFDPEESVDAVCKLLSMSLRYKHWFVATWPTFGRRLALKLRGKEHLLEIRKVLVTHRVLDFHHRDPVSVSNEIDKVISNLRGDACSVRGTQNQPQITRELLMHEPMRLDLKQLQAEIDSLTSHNFEGLDSLITVMKAFGKFDLWTGDQMRLLLSKALAACRDDPHELQRLCMQYLSSVSWSEQDGSKEFEQQVMESPAVRDLLTCPFPGKSAVFMAFNLAYSPVFDAALKQRFFELLPCMKISALNAIKTGLRIRKARKQRSFLFRQVANLYPTDDMEVAVGDRNLQLFREALENLPFTFDSFTLTLVHPDCLDEETTKYLSDQISTMASQQTLPLRVVTLISSHMSWVRPPMSCPRLIDSFARSVIESRLHVHALALVPLMQLAYSTGYEPANRNLVDIFAGCLVRDAHSMQGVQVIKSCLYLAWMRNLTPSISAYVFSANFMEQLDHEASVLGKKYLSTTTRMLVELNRVACLLFPELGVAWFSQDISEDTAAGGNNRRDDHELGLIRSEVYQTLAEAVGGHKFVRENVYTHYYNHIDFEVTFDESGRPVLSDQLPSVIRRQNSADDPRYTRFAVLLVPASQTTQNAKAFSGLVDLTVWQLEAQGFEVLIIDPCRWNALSMADRSEKLRFFNERLRVAAKS